MACLPCATKNARAELRQERQELTLRSPHFAGNWARICPYLQALRTQLKNGKIQLKIRIDEANEKRLAYTSAEKFELLNEINPLLSKLKDEFNLMFD